jgi:hypothetical protein
MTDMTVDEADAAWHAARRRYNTQLALVHQQLPGWPFDLPNPLGPSLRSAILDLARFEREWHQATLDRIEARPAE